MHLGEVGNIQNNYKHNIRINNFNNIFIRTIFFHQVNVDIQFRK